MLREILEGKNTEGNVSWKGKTSPEDKWDIVELIQAYDENASFSGMSGGDWQRASENNQMNAKDLRKLGVKSFIKNNVTINLK